MGLGLAAEATRGMLQYRQPDQAGQVFQAVQVTQPVYPSSSSVSVAITIRSHLRSLLGCPIRALSPPTHLHGRPIFALASKIGRATHVPHKADTSGNERSTTVNSMSVVSWQSLALAAWTHPANMPDKPRCRPAAPVPG
jgi:hypothetical protein